MSAKRAYPASRRPGACESPRKHDGKAVLVALLRQRGRKVWRGAQEQEAWRDWFMYVVPAISKIATEAPARS